MTESQLAQLVNAMGSIAMAIAPYHQNDGAGRRRALEQAKEQAMNDLSDLVDEEPPVRSLSLFPGIFTPETRVKDEDNHCPACETGIDDETGDDCRVCGGTGRGDQ